jgi:hypothetical protein
VRKYNALFAQAMAVLQFLLFNALGGNRFDLATAVSFEGGKDIGAVCLVATEVGSDILCW